MFICIFYFCLKLRLLNAFNQVLYFNRLYNIFVKIYYIVLFNAMDQLTIQAIKKALNHFYLVLYVYSILNYQ